MLAVPCTHTHASRPAPPVKPSQSLEGLEQVIPPTSPLVLSSPLSLTGRPYYLQLDKPLPEKPLPNTPPSMGHAGSMASSNSNETSTLDSRSRYSGRESSRYSSDSCPIFVRTGSEYGGERPYSGVSGDVGKGELLSPTVPTPLVTRHSPDPLEAFPGSDNEESDVLGDLEDLEAWNDDDDYNDHHLDARWSQIRHTATDFTQARNDNSHYFREKKWDFFPELAPVAGMSKRPCRQASAVQAKKRNTSAFDFRQTRTNTLTGAPALATNVRDSIRSAVQKTLKSSLEKEKEKRRRQPRPSTAKRAAAASMSDFSDSTTSIKSIKSKSRSKSKQKSERSDYLYAIQKSQPPCEKNISIVTRIRSLSMSTGSSSATDSPRSTPPHHGPAYPKQLAVPLSPYQKFGAAIFDKPSTPSIFAKTSTQPHNHNRFYQTQPRTRRWSLSTPTASYTSTSTASYITNNSSTLNLTATKSYPKLPTSPPLRSQLQRGTKALHDGTSYMRDALGGAKRRVVDARMHRRRAQLKAQIRLIGPVNPYTTYGRVDPWDYV
ncbi:uncharacterized protein EURHEDRAFT_408496 [Aspergillus ruber CBS 135680]|uniref:Uncharacterized protein n=1 Tax=Aspergillus ruber (strain CBS 135680) TaxID=1388766 RepID=A0A017SQH0_ASPRC|nr:uncharacterized protein EURHEDRAFT_408496 [Aspergillus ruber CBS 135680]EYE99228.1 hypothetical protein EURHEDRAFT_408496 [Aspergillus ruber CBS 135680]